MREGLYMIKEYSSLAQLIMDDESFYEQFRFEKDTGMFTFYVMFLMLLHKLQDTQSLT